MWPDGLVWWLGPVECDPLGWDPPELPPDFPPPPLWFPPPPGPPANAGLIVRAMAATARSCFFMGLAPLKAFVRSAGRCCPAYRAERRRRGSVTGDLKKCGRQADRGGIEPRRGGTPLA